MIWRMKPCHISIHASRFTIGKRPAVSAVVLSEILSGNSEVPSLVMKCITLCSHIRATNQRRSSLPIHTQCKFCVNGVKLQNLQ